MKSLNRFREYFLKGVLLAYLAYVPWHDALFLGQRPKLSDTVFSFIPRLIPSAIYVTTSGLMNMLWIVLLTLSLAWTLLHHFRSEKINLLGLAVWLWPIYVFFNVRLWNSSALVVLLNAYLMTLILSFLIVSDEFGGIKLYLKKYGLNVFLISYLFALFLPLLIPVEGYDPMIYFGSVVRYRGWLGEGQPLSFGGLALMIWSGVEYFRKKELRFNLVVGILAGFVGIYLNVLRIGIGAGALFFTVLTIALIASKTKIWVWGFPAAVALGLGTTFFTGIFADQPFTFSSAYSDQGVNVSEYLITKSEGSRIFGSGTGFARTVLTEGGTKIPEVGGDYLRIFVEHGAVGSILFIGLMFSIIWVFRGHPNSIIIIALMISMLTDLVSIIPTFGYGPILLAGFIAPTAPNRRSMFDWLLEFIMVVSVTPFQKIANRIKKTFLLS